jgi:hypothetical protein
MKKKFYRISWLSMFSFLLVPLLFPGTVQPQRREGTLRQAQSTVRDALIAMGGEEKLRSLKSLRYEGIGHIYSVEQSERPEGPWIVNYVQIAESKDLVKQKVRTSTQMRNSQIPDWIGTTQIVADGVASAERGGKYFPVPLLQVDSAIQNMSLAPERILINALGAADLQVAEEVEIHGQRQKVVKFTWSQLPVTIFLNAQTNLPTAVETINSSPYDHFWKVWGDYPSRTYYTYWTLETGGIRYPHQWDVERINLPYSSFTISKIQLNTPIEDKEFFIPEETRSKVGTLPKPVKIDEIPLGLPNRPAREIAPGVIKLPGRWDVAYVKQKDGIVIIEAPISSGYSAKVLKEAKRRFPNEKIKGVITTSDAFPHIGGIRQYVAEAIPVYALDLNRPIVERLLAARHTSEPDLLQTKPRKPDLKIISRKTTIGDGANRLELYPIRSETGERMLMIYFPEHKLLYGSDLVQKSLKGGFFMPQYLSEIVQAAERNNLSVDHVFAMHTDLTPWSELINAIKTQVSGE